VTTTWSARKISHPPGAAAPSAHRQRPPRRWIVGQALLLLACVGLFALATAQVHAYESGVVREAFTLRGNIPLPVVRYRPVRAPLNVVAIAVHGYSANKEMMSTFGADLARQGVTVYTYDLPGHGASTVPYVGHGELVASLGEVVDYALAHPPGPHTKLALIGYSIGTIVVGEYALQHPNLSSLWATVLIAGILQDHPTLTNPRNLLVLSGQFDLPGINDISRNLITAGCGVPPSAVTNTYKCDPHGLYAHRERIVLPGLDHISIVTAASTHTEVIKWLGEYVDPRIGATPVNADARLHWTLAGFAAAAVGTVPLVALGAAAFGLAPARAGSARRRNGRAEASAMPREAAASPWLGVALGIGALAVALVILHGLIPASFWDPTPLAFLAQQISADVATYFLVAGLILIGALALVPPLRMRLVQALRMAAPAQLALGAAVAVFLYFTLGALSTFAWEGLTLTSARAWRAAAYALMLWPFFFGMQTLLSAYWWRRPRSAVLADLASTLVIIVVLLLMMATNATRLSYLGILLPVFAILLLAFIGFNAGARRFVAAPVVLLASAETLVLAWALAATLPLAAG
jgi:pimeloyl-ACP methyl ester carboxylesterase